MQKLWTYWLLLSIAIPIILVLWLGVYQHGDQSDGPQQHADDRPKHPTMPYEPAWGSDSRPVVQTAPNVIVESSSAR